MAETETWTLSLKDMMSGPAATMTQGLRQLDAAQVAAVASGNALANIPPPRGADGKFLKRGSEEWREAMVAASSGAAGVASAGQAAGEGMKAGGSAVADGAAQVTSALDMLKHPVDTATDALKAMGPEGMAVAAALAVLTAAISATIGTMVAFGSKAIEMTERARALREAFAGLAGGAAGGKAVQDMLGHLNLPFAGSQVNAWAATLTAAGVKGRQLEAEIKAIAAAQASGAVFGKQWGSAAEDFFRKMGEGGREADDLVKRIQGGGKGVEALKAMGLNIEDLGGQMAVSKMKANELTAAVTKALQVKGAGSLAALGDTWDVIKMKAMAGLNSIFGGLTGAKGPVETFMGAVKSLFSEFNKGSVLVSALRPIVTVVFTKLFEWGTLALNAIHKGFLMVTIAALTAYIYMRPLLVWIAQFVSSANLLRGVAIIFALLAVPWVVLAAAMLVVTVVIGAVIGVVAALAAAFVYVVGAIAGFVASIGSAFADAYAAATGAGWSIVDGLVAGVMAGAGRFAEAMRGMAATGLSAFEGLFRIGSPSKVMLEHGQKNIAEDALATGIDKGADKVDASMGRLGGGTKPGAKGGDRDGGGEKHYHFHYAGPADQADDFFDRAAMWLLQLEREAAT
ncbi:MAG TPA: hypothetical protein VNI01_11225 [Elusimicrobiota bacterium]|nr:hypothetical protein [Elusimicrobiota bacterium]